MRKQYTLRMVSLRFRRWNRRGYAAFVSVKRAVTIGQLSANVSDRSLVKGGTIHTSVATSSSMHNADDEETVHFSDSSGGSPLTLLLLDAILPQQTAAQPTEGACAYTTQETSTKSRKVAAASRRSSAISFHTNTGKEYD